jgi:hypothetical protein
MYNWMPGPEKTFTFFPGPEGGIGTQQLIESNHHMHTGTFNAVYTLPRASGSRVGAYFLGGPGFYHRTVQLTSPATGYTTVCDPYWYWCYPALVSVDRILGDRSSTDFGINFGGGVTFGGERCAVLRRDAVSLRVGSGSDAPGDARQHHGSVESLHQRSVLPDHVRGPVVTPRFRASP